MRDLTRAASMLTFHDLLLLVHVFSMLSWLGAMYFNLTLLFPMYQAQGPSGYAHMMQSQAARAAPLLYALIALTAASGIGLALTSAAPFTPLLAAKGACLLAMLACHLTGTLGLWPRVFLALDAEKPRLFFLYRLSMFASASFGTCAILLTYLGKRIVP